MNSNTKFEPAITKPTLPKPIRVGEISPTRLPPNFLNVLVVDGESVRGIANSEMISDLGHAVELAQDGITALRMASAKRPDVVLLNADLRCLDGCNVTSHLRSDFPEPTPLIIGFATHTDRLMRRQCVNAGMDLVLEAPLNLEAIETLLLLECARLVVEKEAASMSHSRPSQAQVPTQTLTIEGVDWPQMHFGCA